MKLPDIRQANLEGKRILMRVDFNVPIKDGKIQEEHRIKAVKETADFVLAQKETKLALLSHLGRPDGRDEQFSFGKIYKEIAQILKCDMIFLDDCVGKKVEEALSGLQTGRILMLENVRFCEGEKDTTGKFAQKLVENFDIYINEAFSVSHRNQTSLTQVPRLLPSFAGINLQREVAELSRATKDFNRPAVAIIGGAKVETKLSVINFFAEKYDAVLVGGKIGLEAKKQGVVFSSANIFLPKDYKGKGLDIGPETINDYVGRIAKARTIVWNGPLGKFEEEKYAVGTRMVLKSIVENTKDYKIAGGGETIQFLEKNNLMDKFNFVSTGGGAMLEFLIKGTLPALKALQE